MAKTEKKQPDILSGQEALWVLRTFDSVKHKTIAVLCYGARLRINEALHLKLKDIDSARGLNAKLEANGRGQPRPTHVSDIDPKSDFLKRFRPKRARLFVRFQIYTGRDNSYACFQ